METLGVIIKIIHGQTTITTRIISKWNFQLIDLKFGFWMRVQKV